MKIVQRKISELIDAEYNPRRLSKDQYKNIKDSLTRFGMVDPIIVNVHPDRKNIIIGGHMRAKVWGDMGNDTIDAVEISLTPDKERELNIRLNKNAGEWDWDILANQFDDADLIEWGFTEEELTGNFSALPLGETEGDEVEDVPENSDDIKCPKCGFKIKIGVKVKKNDK